MIKKIKKIKFIDLDLPSGNLWSDRNLNADSINDQGPFYMWNSKYNYLYKENRLIDILLIRSVFNSGFYKTYVDNKLDLVTLLLGKDYKTPSVEDFRELVKYTKIEKIKSSGCRLISNINEKMIFMTFNGFLDPGDDNLKNKLSPSDHSCCFWTSTKDMNYDNHSFDYYINFNNIGNDVSGFVSVPYYHGLCIRLIKIKNDKENKKD